MKKVAHCYSLTKIERKKTISDNGILICVILHASNSQKADSNSSQTSRNSQKVPSQTKSIGSKNSQKSDSSADSLILSQHLSQMSKEKYESEVNETLEMTKVGNIWFLSPLVLSK